MTMFCSGSNPFPELPSSPNVFFPPNIFFDHEKDCSCFNYHLNNSDPFISGDCFHDTNNSLAPPSPAIYNNITTIKQDFCRQKQLCSEEQVFQTCEDHDDLLQSVISTCKKKTAASKDGHSKIYTARGPRDRRVRLSIEISRKFFSLQDLLGFDKASKTVDWLFSKCKTAIKELVEETNFYSSSTASYQSKTSFLESIMGVRDGGKSKRKLELTYVEAKGKKITQKSKGGFQDNLERGHSRAMARARARERVREKMRIRKLDDELKTIVHDDFNYQNFKSSAGDNHKVSSAHPAAW